MKEELIKELDIYSDLMTWLNGRATEIKIIHEGKELVLWKSQDEISIEDTILEFCNKYKINIKEEVTI